MQMRTPRSCVQWYFVRMYTHEKNKHTGIAHLAKSKMRYSVKCFTIKDKGEGGDIRIEQHA